MKHVFEKQHRHLQKVSIYSENMEMTKSSIQLAASFDTAVPQDMRWFGINIVIYKTL